MASPPDSFAVHNVLVFGDRIANGTYLARGMWIDLPDVRRADNATKNQLRQQALTVLASIGADYALQWQWSVEGDYDEALARYARRTEEQPKDSWSKWVRAQRHRMLTAAREEGRLRRERLVVYLSLRCKGLMPADLKSTDRLEAFLKQQARVLGERLEHVGRLFSFARCRVMDDEDHFAHAAQWYNPSMPSLSHEEARRYPWRRDWSMLCNTFWGDGVPFRSKREDLVGLYFDQRHHALVVLRDWPRQTHPGLIHQLTEALGPSCAITLNVYPCDVQAEIAVLEKDRAELMKQVDDPKKFHLRSEVERKGRKIAALMEGQGVPSKVLWVIRVWAPTLEALGARTLALKAALQRWTGCRYHQANHEMQARALFFDTCPGWLGGTSTDWHCEAESTFLADLLPLSSTFVGHLDDADALLEGRGGGVVGLRIFSQGTPQHACLVGMRGAGKSSVTLELLAQTESLAGFTGVIEEGLSYGSHAQLSGYQTLILKPGASYTWNYFDTQGMPLHVSHLAEAAALLVKLSGTPAGDEQAKVRAALFTEYLRELYDGAAEDWERADEKRYLALAREACTIHRRQSSSRRAGSFWDAYLEARDFAAQHPAEWEAEMAGISERDVVAFMRSPETAARVREMVFSRFRPDEFPTHAALCAVLRSGRLPHHRSLALAKELDTVGMLLGKWTASGGLYGPLVDGVTNIEWRGRGLHVELGYLGEENTELKEVAGFLATSQMRRRVVSLPRSIGKRLVYEEVAKFLTVPGASEILAENYAQFRKYRCWVLTVFQNADQLLRADPSLLRTLRANSTQFWFMRHQDADALSAMGDPVGLPQAARAEILSYPLPEHQTGLDRATYFTLFARDQGVPVCGTVRVKVSPEMLYVATSSGETFEERQRLLANDENPLRTLLDHVQRLHGRSSTSNPCESLASS